MYDYGVNLCSSQYSNYLLTLKAHSIEAGINDWIAISNSENECERNLSYCVFCN